MSYDEAFNKSMGWVKHYWRVWSPNNILYEDYYQECALFFFKNLINKYSPYECWVLSKQGYKWVLLKLLQIEVKQSELKKKYKNEIKLYELFMYVEEIPYELIGLNKRQQVICNKILQGYDKNEIKEYTKYQYLLIRKTIASFYNIPKHLQRHNTKYSLETCKKRSARMKGVAPKHLIHINDKACICLDKHRNKVGFFKSIKEMAKWLNVDNSYLSKVIKRKTLYKGLYFEYATD